MFKMIKRESKEAGKIFNENFDENFVTPDVIEYLETDNYYIEISTGMVPDTDWNYHRRYGVTVLDKEGNNLHGLGKLLGDEVSARKYIRKLSKRTGVK